LEAFIGCDVEVEMKPGPPWYGHTIVGTFERAPESAGEGAVKLVHKRAGDVILLPAAVHGIGKAKVRQ
jgi:hypothetical protein